MVGRLVTVCAAALLLVPLAWGSGPTAPVGGDDMLATATLSTAAPGAGPVALTVRLHAELQCGRLVVRTLVVRLPDAMHVPRAIPRTAVRVGTARASAVTTSGSSIRIAVPAVPPGRAICNVIGPGVFPVAFTTEAGLRNPARAGAYRFAVSAPQRGIWRGVLRIG